MAAFQVVDQGLQRHAGSDEHRSSAEDLGVRVDDAVLARHVANHSAAPLTRVPHHPLQPRDCTGRVGLAVGGDHALVVQDRAVADDALFGGREFAVDSDRTVVAGVAADEDFDRDA